MPNPSTLAMEEKFDGDTEGPRLVYDERKYESFFGKQVEPPKVASMKEYSSGANRAGLNKDGTAKVDLEGFLSPVALKVFGDYMNKNRQTAKGIRESDNWQLGIPQEDYMKSLIRHVLDAWLIHRGQAELAREDWNDALCGIFFNVQGLLHEGYLVRPSKET